MLVVITQGSCSKFLIMFLFLFMFIELYLIIYDYPEISGVQVGALKFLIPYWVESFFHIGDLQLPIFLLWLLFRFMIHWLSVFLSWVRQQTHKKLSVVNCAFGRQQNQSVF